MNLLQTRFDELLSEAIDEELCSLGEPIKNYLYSHLENNYGVQKQDIPKEINVFSKMLHRIFGLGASRLEIKFMEKLYVKIKVKIEWPEGNWSKWIENDISFLAYVEEMRQSFMVSGC
jgi:hypothetical protein